MPLYGKSRVVKRTAQVKNAFLPFSTPSFFRSPPKTYGGSGPKAVVYLYGDPLASISSHYRRGHAFHQAIKTNGCGLGHSDPGLEPPPLMCAV